MTTQAQEDNMGTEQVVDVGFAMAQPGWWLVNAERTEAVPIAGWGMQSLSPEGRSDSFLIGAPVTPSDDLLIEDSHGEVGTAWFAVYLPDGLPEGIAYPGHPDNWETSEVAS